MSYLLLTLLACLTSLAHAETACRPTMVDAIARAQAKCLLLGCRHEVTRTAAILAAHPDYTAAQVFAYIEQMHWRSRIPPDAAVALLSELGLMDLKAR